MGAGKTHSIHGVQQALARSLYGGPGIAPASASTSASTHAPAALVVIFEMRGRRHSDLLNERRPVKLLQGDDGVVAAAGAKVVRCGSEAELLAAFAAANALRSVAATERNAQSSRSHAVCRLELRGFASSDTAGAAESGGGGGGGGGGGVLTLVVLAGSERNEESIKSRGGKAAREASDINSSLAALKDCFRAISEKDV